MPSGVYTRTEKHMQQIHELHKKPRSQKQLANSHKSKVFGDDIVKHHNDLCHGAERPNDITYMTLSEHTSLHHNLRKGKEIYHDMKKTTIYFQKLIRQNKNQLINGGLNWTTVRSWAYGYRMPDFENALKIADILDIPVKEIPYRQVIINNP